VSNFKNGYASFGGRGLDFANMSLSPNLLPSSTNFSIAPFAGIKSMKDSNFAFFVGETEQSSFANGPFSTDDDVLDSSFANGPFSTDDDVLDSSFANGPFSTDDDVLDSSLPFVFFKRCSTTAFDDDSRLPLDDEDAMEEDEAVDDLFALLAADDKADCDFATTTLAADDKADVVDSASSSTT